MASHHLAQINIGHPRGAMDSAEMAGFVAELEPLNALADTAPGFIWRMQYSPDGNATSIPGFVADAGPSGIIINMSVWESVDALADYVLRSRHVEVMRRRREWFHRMADAFTALWWVPAGHRPTVAEAEERVAALRSLGPTPLAFTLGKAFAAPEAVPAPRPSRDARPADAAALAPVAPSG